MTISLKNISELPEAAKVILKYAETKLPSLGKDGEGRIFCFYGELGAGKTTLIKELCKQLGVKDKGSSPTFSLVNEYQTKDKLTLFHFDLYRLKNESEIYDIGYEDYIFSGNYCFIEWPEKIQNLLPKIVVKVSIGVKDSTRIIAIE